MASVVSFFLTGPHTTVEQEVEKIVKEHEALNPRHKAIVKVIRSTTEGCAPGTTQHFYSLDLIHFDDLEDEE